MIKAMFVLLLTAAALLVPSAAHADPVCVTVPPSPAHPGGYICVRPTVQLP